MKTVTVKPREASAALLAAFALAFWGSGTALATEPSPSVESAASESRFAIDKGEDGNVYVTLENATISFEESYKSPSILDAHGDPLGALPTKASVGDIDATISYLPVDDHHFIVNYYSERFDWGCYGRGIATGTVGGVAGGAAWGAVSGLPFVPVEPVTITGGAVSGAITGLVGGIVGGVVACW